MSQNEKDILLDHDADGIREYDNDLPRWWLYGFYFTIIMSVIYMFYYHIYTGEDWNVLWFGPRGAANEYAVEMAEGAALKASAPKKSTMAITLLTDSESLEKGKDIFNGPENVCATCHREDLGGMVGPDLTDDYWLHGCSIEEVAASIVSGFPDKGMVPYGSGIKLGDLQLMQVASYIVSMRGSKPVNPKPAEEGRDVLCSSSPQ